MPWLRIHNKVSWLLVVGEPPEVVVIFFGCVGAEIAGRELGLAELAKLQEVVNSVIDETQCPGGIAAVAAALVEGCRF